MSEVEDVLEVFPEKPPRKPKPRAATILKIKKFHRLLMQGLTHQQAAEQMGEKDSLKLDKYYYRYPEIR